MNTHFTIVLDYKEYSLVKQSQEYTDHIFGKTAKWAKRIDAKMKSAVIKALDYILILSFVHNYKTACDPKGILKRMMMCLFQRFTKNLAKLHSHNEFDP